MCLLELNRFCAGLARGSWGAAYSLMPVDAAVLSVEYKLNFQRVGYNSIDIQSQED